MKRITLLVAGLLVLLGPTAGARQDGLVPAPDRRSGEGLGPFPTLTIRNVMVIDGTGAPPFGPANVIVENNRIARIVNAGTPGHGAGGSKSLPQPQDPLRHRHLRLNDSTGRTERVGGVRYTIKDGIVYDAKQLLADVGAMVAAQKQQGKGQP